jgi:twitching motility two-component system response regulator PilH
LARKILLADDSVTAQNMGRKILSDAGYEVITVNNGSAALKRIAEQKPDLIVLDVYMPGYSGLEVCQRLKETQETGRIPVLLTVGKLEPFKPEEAKRARADAFIVKPFEASELLSALTKLEDKIVPRAETSKPGRFARSIAAIEEGRYDRTMAAEEDSGWKSRISFPSAKKSSETEDHDDAAIYNPVNKDLRTTVENRPGREPQKATPGDAQVDLGALATQGLPKDVTPEEIAALAAAAAQVQGSFAASKKAEAAPQPAATGGTAEEAKIVPTADAKAETPSIYEQVTVEIPRAAVLEAMRTDATQADATRAEVTRSEKAEEKQKTEAPSHESNEAKETSAAASLALTQGPDTAPSPAAPAGFADANSGNGSGAHGAGEQHSEHHFEQPAEEPVTMAVAAGAAPGGGASRWTAVAVALAPEESAISLENEMQKAYAAFAAAAGTESQAASRKPELTGAEAMRSGQVAHSDSEKQAAIAASASVPEMEQKLEVSGAAKEDTGASAKEFEAATESHTDPIASSSSSNTLSAEASSAQAGEPSINPERLIDAKTFVEPAHQEPQSVDAKAEDHPGVVGAQHPDLDAQHEEAAKLDGEQTILKDDQPSALTDAAQAAKEESREEAVPESAAATIRSEFATEETSVAGVVSSGEEAAQVTTTAPRAAEGTAHKESDIAATTAAAWASWRRIRESGDSKSPNTESVKKGTPASAPPEDTAAMAVAAGAEHKPEGSRADDSEPEEIANIVDSVLADLRPKIVEEISRKLGKKK